MHFSIVYINLHIQLFNLYILYKDNNNNNNNNNNNINNNVYRNNIYVYTTFTTFFFQNCSVKITTFSVFKRITQAEAGYKPGSGIFKLETQVKKAMITSIFEFVIRKY